MKKSDKQKLEVLLPYQKRWIEDNSEQKILEKGRRTGGSFGEALASVLAAIPAEGWSNTYYLGYNKDMTRQFISDCSWWATQLQVACSDVIEEKLVSDENKDITTFRITFSSGATIQGLPSEAYVLRSKQGRVILDEAAFCSNFNEIVKAAQALLIWGGQFIIISTHNGEDNPFNQLVRSVKEGRDRQWSIHTLPFSLAVEEGLYQRICLQKGEKWSVAKESAWIEKIRKIYKDNGDEELECIPVSGQGKYFSPGLLNSCRDEHVPIIRWNFGSDFLFKNALYKKREVEKLFRKDVEHIIRCCTGKVYIGEDFARSGDLTVYWILEQAGTRCRVRAVVEVKNCPFEEQENTARMMLHAAREQGKLGGMAIDGRGNGQQIAEAMSLEFPGAAVAVMETAAWYAEWFPKMKALMEGSEWTVPDDQTIMADFGIVVLKNGNPYVPDIRLKDRDGGKRHGDAALAAVLACYAVSECAASPAPMFYSAKNQVEKKSIWDKLPWH